MYGRKRSSKTERKTERSKYLRTSGRRRRRKIFILLVLLLAFSSCRVLPSSAPSADCRRPDLPLPILDPSNYLSASLHLSVYLSRSIDLSVSVSLCLALSIHVWMYGVRVQLEERRNFQSSAGSADSDISFLPCLLS